MRRSLSRTIATAAVVVGGLIAGACSGTTPYDYSGPSSARTTLAGDSAASDSPLATGPRLPAASDLPTSTVTRTEATIVFPGLTEECSAAIHLQSAVSELFAKAMEPATGKGAPPTSADSTSADDSAAGPDAGDTPSGLTEGDVAAAFDSLSLPVPPRLTKAAAVLRGAAEEAVGKPVAAIPDILAQEDVADAITELSDFIDACRPEGSTTR